MAVASRADGFPYTFTKVGPEYRLTLQSDPEHYFGFQHTGDLLQPFSTLKMALGNPGPMFGYTPGQGESRAFFRAEGISVFAPRDSDGDSMDDLWELTHSYLDPLDPTDAAKPSPNIPGFTNLDEYRFLFSYDADKPQYYGREASVFNFGAPTAAFEAISREQSIFNFGTAFYSVEAVAREVSVFNGEHVPIAGYPEVYSRESSIYNFGSPLFSMEATGREVSVFNGEHVPIAGYPEIYSRETSVFNFGVPTASIEAISREVSVFNNIE